jgi:hypothetical protein
VDLLRRMPVEEYIPAADAGPEALEAAQYDWLRRHGLERGRVDAALGALRDDLNSRVHPPADPAVTAGGGPGGGQVPPQSRPSPAVTELRRDRLGMWRNIQGGAPQGTGPGGALAGPGGTAREALRDRPDRRVGGELLAGVETGTDRGRQ